MQFSECGTSVLQWSCLVCLKFGYFDVNYYSQDVFFYSYLEEIAPF